MDIPIITKQPWSFSDRLLHTYNEQNLENTLSSFNQAGGGSFYLLDFFRKKIIVDSPSSLILCGYPIDLVKEKGFDFFQQILSEKELEWLIRVNEESYNFFFSFPEHRRKDLFLSYDLTVQTAKNEKRVLHHKVAPYKLCKNGNLWLGLYHVWSSSQRELGRSFIIDNKTNEQYNFIDNKFVKVDKPHFDQEDLLILRYMIADLSDKQMNEMLHISLSSFKRKKRLLFQKLDANTSACAIHKAHLMGVI